MLERFTKDYAEIDRTLDIKQKFYALTSRLITDYGRMVILLVGLLANSGV